MKIQPQCHHHQSGTKVITSGICLPALHIRGPFLVWPGRSVLSVMVQLLKVMMGFLKTNMCMGPWGLLFPDENHSSPADIVEPMAESWMVTCFEDNDGNNSSASHM